jgi:predicted Zn-dependent protease with MMP-like domain
MLRWDVLVRIAEDEVRDVLDSLPPDFVPWASEIPVIFEARPPACLCDDGLDADTLGLFVGLPHSLLDAGVPGHTPVHIQLFLENLWRYGRHDVARYREEVRRTLLHELGHYLGWDEEDLAGRGLD